uniref:BPTI/Kunitz inhibitor domain-containing protein n=1 Tax=Wuchereria bancrofti TaxID=6293 RepID=A0AAF5PYZ9_WUCBA
MLLNVTYCFIPQLIILLLFITETNGNTVDGNTVISNDDDAFFRHIFKFLYENEQLCGDVFAEPQWLPAQSDCQILCPVTKGLCLIYVNLSNNGARIHKQKCRHFQSNCTSELQRLLTTSALTNTTPIAIADIILTNITNTIDTTINNTNNAIKYHKKEVWNKMHGRIHADHWDSSRSSNTTDATFQPTSEIWNRRSGKRKETQFKRNFHGKIINNQKSIRSYRANK